MGQHEIKKFTIHQFKGIRGTIEIEPGGPGCIVIAGPNGAGKSGVVDGIMQVVAGVGVKGIPKPIHEGKDEAYTEIETTHARARRSYKGDDAGKLEVWSPDGAKYSSGKDFMMKATGSQVFDTAEFEMKADKDQRAELLRRVALPFDLDELEGKRRTLFDDRTNVGRDVTRLQGQLSGFPAATDGPREEVSAAAILAEHEQAVRHNADIDQQSDSLRSIQRGVEETVAKVDRLAEELDAARAYLSRAQETEADLRKLVAAAVRIDTDEISARLNAVEETNASIRVQAQRETVADELATRTAEQNSLTAKLAAIDKTKADGLSAAAFPVAGLGIDETGITFDGIPFKQINAAQRIIVAFDLFTLEKPDLRIIFIKNGDLLDEVSLAGIERVAVERGYYVVMERARLDGDAGFRFTVAEGALVRP